jgi:hypothetical protein
MIEKVKEKYKHLNELTYQQKCQLATFIDTDGSITMQLVPRKDYRLRYQIRVSIAFHQKTKRFYVLEGFHLILKIGSLRKRQNDEMGDYTIVGFDNAIALLTILLPFFNLKTKQVELALNIMQKYPEPSKLSPQEFVEACEMVDRFESLNDSKNRKHRSSDVRKALGLDLEL